MINICSAPWWRDFLVLLRYMFTDVTAQYSQCPLVETDFITSLLILWRYVSTAEKFTVIPSADGYYYFVVYRYDSSTGIFTVTSGGNGFCFFSAYC